MTNKKQHNTKTEYRTYCRRGFSVRSMCTVFKKAQCRRAEGSFYLHSIWIYVRSRKERASFVQITHGIRVLVISHGMCVGREGQSGERESGRKWGN